MTEEKKSRIKRTIAVVELILAATLVVYLIYGIATKNSNQIIFNALAIFVVVAYVLLNDFVEPYLTEVLFNMNDFRKEAYKKYLLWDIAAMAGLLFFVLTFTEEGNNMTYLGLIVYFIGTKQKRPYQSVYTGHVTEEDVEAAKAAVVDSEAVEIEDVQENIEE